MRKQRTLIGKLRVFALLIAVVVCVVGLLAAPVARNWWDERSAPVQFSPSLWRQVPEQRTLMARDLVQSRVLLSKTPRQVESLIGKPQSAERVVEFLAGSSATEVAGFLHLPTGMPSADAESFWLYGLGGGIVEDDQLVVVFGSSGQVVSAFTRER